MVFLQKHENISKVRYIIFRDHMLISNLAVVWQYFFIIERVHMYIHLVLCICIPSVFQITKNVIFRFPFQLVVSIKHLNISFNLKKYFNKA